MDLLDKGWFIIFLVIAFIGGNLAALRVTANMKFPRGRAPTQRDEDAPVEPHTDDSTDASDGNTPDTPPEASKVAPSAPPSPTAANVPQPTLGTEQNVTATQREKAVRKQDHNHNNDLV